MRWSRLDSPEILLPGIQELALYCGRGERISILIIDSLTFP